VTTRQQVRAALEARPGETVSGAALARGLNLSRNAIWKAVAALRAEGYAVESVDRRGYRLSADSDILTAEGIAHCLGEEISTNAGRAGESGAPRVHVFPALASTNLTAKEFALRGAPHGTAVLAEAQSAGRGRYGRAFFSPAGCGLYMSVVLRPAALPFDDPALTTSVAAALVAQAVEEASALPVRVKWVNDLYVHGKKVCGILTEAVTGVESGVTEFLVLGIGINVNAPEDVFPAELKDIATSLFAEGGKKLSRNRLAAGILRRVRALTDPADALAFYRDRLLYVGRRVTVRAPSGAYEAVALGVDGQCHLIVRTDDGREAALSSGEISVLPV
jgi:BirA family biotin operon repressor/biotin-[acetyl-CoA-carboxylase] ligase